MEETLTPQPVDDLNEKDLQVAIQRIFEETKQIDLRIEKNQAGINRSKLRILARLDSLRASL